ncbi:MAG: hypothetical protein JSS00_15205 [Proteobacteria bacterium]|nr:hypothetical protein [Pseudomonadota bacterium]
MPTSVFVNDRLALRVHRQTGAISVSEIKSLIELYRANPGIFMYDVIQILDDTAAFDFGVEQLQPFKVDYRNLVEGAEPPILLRSAWVCPSPAAWTMLEAWLHERHTLDGLRTDTCLVATLDEAALIFDDDELDAVRSMMGFRPYFSA